nr:LmeA family phospholipid-binding protein [Oscillatoria sp. FACHB-1406]
MSGLLAGLTPPGFIVDTVAENQIRANLEGVEVVDVRVDNTPSYQVIAGKIDRVRVATRGVQLTPQIRVAALELETDPLNVDLAQLRGGGSNPLKALRQPLQAGVRLVLTEDDLNTALQSPMVQARIQKALVGVAGNFSKGGGNYRLASTRIDLLGKNRLRFEANLRLTGLTAEDLDRVLAAKPQDEVSKLQQGLRRVAMQLQGTEALDAAQLQSRLSALDIPQLQARVDRVQQLNLEDVQAFASEVEKLDLPSESQIFPRPLPAVDVAGLRSQLTALQGALATPRRGDNLAQRLQTINKLTNELQQPLEDLRSFFIAFQRINVANARPFTLEAKPLKISLESGIAIDSATKLRLVEPTAAIDDNPLPAFILQAFIGSINSGLDLRRWETSGYTIRLLQLEVNEDEIKTAAFVRLEPNGF